MPVMVTSFLLAKLSVYSGHMSQLWPMINEGKYVERLLRKFHIPKKGRKVFPFMTLYTDIVIPETVTAWNLATRREKPRKSQRSGFWSSGITFNQQIHQCGHTLSGLFAL